jgi:hypothetical protein
LLINASDVAQAQETVAAILREGRPSSSAGRIDEPRPSRLPWSVVESADDVAYLDFQGAVARTDSFGVQLGPAAFQDEETLVRTLGHESVHVRQHQEDRVTTMTGPLEDEAYQAEDGFVAAWRSNRS